MSYETTFKPADKHNTARCETRIPLGPNGHELRIETRKDYREGVSTKSTAVWAHADGNGYTHAFGLAGGGDYSRKMLHDRAARGTEKTLRTMHAAALADVEAEIARARAHYAPQALAA